MRHCRQLLPAGALLLCVIAAGCGDEKDSSRSSSGGPGGGGEPPAPAAPKPAGLIGTWEFQTPRGTARLEIRSETELVFLGDPARYRREGDTLHVTAEGRNIDYAIELSGDRLAITFPDGQRHTFQRAGAASPAAPAAAPAPGGGQTGPNDPRLLARTLMNFGSATGVRSRYARTTRVTFDGRGGFVVRNETQFRSDAGGHYANPVVSRGTYRIDGQRVVLTFSDGETGVAQVKMRQNDGRITELIYNGDLYGPEP